jgi:hydrogenase nickel incorporation protein HypB
MNIPVLRNVHEKNSVKARQVREALDEHRIHMVNVMGGPGCGKTSLLERILPGLRRTLRCAVLEGDIATIYDAERIAALSIPVCQLQTEGACHLDAALVLDGLRELPLHDLDLVLVENVGNLVCPAEFDIGEHARLAVLSIMEGHDKPAKYPLLFTRASAVALAKCDLKAQADFDRGLAVERIRQLNRTVPIFDTGRNCPGDLMLSNWLTALCGRSRRRGRPETTLGELIGAGRMGDGDDIFFG